MGGIGKTTLARNVYKDPLIKQHFDVRFWVTVTQEYHVEELLQGLLPKPGTMDECCAGMLIERVYNSLKGRRYLIVLDDLWDDGVWDQLRMALPNENNGSRIIVTSRLRGIAAVENSSSPHCIGPLNVDESWVLLREKVYGQEHCPQQLEEIGKTIARSCRGTPLLIVVISGLLKFNKTIKFWDSVAKDIMVARATHDFELLPILSLVYDNLPHHLKGCFLYMGIFPRRYGIPVNKLIKLWVAEGFLKSTTSKSLEEVAGDYVGELVNRNLIFVGKKSPSGRIKFCDIHDILRDLNIKKGLEAQFFRHYGYGYHYKDISEIFDMQRRLIIDTTCLNHLPDDILGSFIRSLLFFPPNGVGLLSFASNFLLLKVLDGLEIKSECFPDEILNLVNLRYLAFIYSYASTCYVLASLSKLKNLQTLSINDTDNCANRILNLFMPSEIWKMPQLRHLVLNKYAILPIPDSDKVGESYYILHNLLTEINTDIAYDYRIKSYFDIGSFVVDTNLSSDDNKLSMVRRQSQAERNLISQSKCLKQL